VGNDSGLGVALQNDNTFGADATWGSARRVGAGRRRIRQSPRLYQNRRPQVNTSALMIATNRECNQSKYPENHRVATGVNAGLALSQQEGTAMAHPAGRGSGSGLRMSPRTWRAEYDCTYPCRRTCYGEKITWNFAQGEIPDVPGDADGLLRCVHRKIRLAGLQDDVGALTDSLTQIAARGSRDWGERLF